MVKIGSALTSCADKARLITRLRRHHKLADLLQVAGLARSTFYYQCREILRSEQQSDMKVKIRTIYDEHKGRCGYRRITAALCRSMAEPVNHKCVQRLMQKMGLRALIRAKKSFRHVSSMSDVNVPNVLQRDFFAKAPNQKWVTDVTEFNVHGQKLYLSACMDLYKVKSSRTVWQDGLCSTWCLTRFEKPWRGQHVPLS